MSTLARDISFLLLFGTFMVELGLCVRLADRPASYVSELSGLTCKTSGFFPHPTNATKFYRCVALHLNSSFMIYLFSCESGLLYEPTVGACVKSLGEEQMDSITKTVSKANNNVNDFVRNWETERCRNGSNTGKRLFRSPVNCRRFFRCSNTSARTVIKVERFSCPTGLFFDEMTHACTWASETSSCNVLDTTDDLQITIDSPNLNPSPSTQAPSTPQTLVTIWYTSQTKNLPISRKTTILEDSLFLYTTPATTTTATTIAPATSDVSVATPLESDNSELKQFLKPAPYLTATGVLVVDGSEFHCQETGSFAGPNPCVFYKCERYVWLSSFLLFRFQCPPHTVFANGTCQYSPNPDCAVLPSGLIIKQKNSNTAEAPSVNNDGKTELCLKEGIFPLPYSNVCSTRFMMCRYLIAPLHFFVSVHECPPSLVFSGTLKRCIDPAVAVSDLNCTADIPTKTSYVASGTDQYYVSSDPAIYLPATSMSDGVRGGSPLCQFVGFIKLSCKHFRRCQWLVRTGNLEPVWVSYDFECGKGMIFDLGITACIRPPLDSVTNSCQDLQTTPSTLEGLPSYSVTSEMSDFTSSATDLASYSGATDTTLGSNQNLTLSPLAPSDISSSTQQPSSPQLENLDKSNLATTVSQTSTSNGIFESTTTDTIGAIKLSGAGKNLVCLRSGYFLYPSDQNCQRFYRCLQLTPEPNSFVMLHYRCDDGFVFDGRYSACTSSAASPSCTQLQKMAGLTSTASDSPVDSAASDDSSIHASSQAQFTPHPANAEHESGGGGSPVKVLPQVWQMADQDADNHGAASLVCTTQRVYRLQTCGYYYSCIQKENGKFHLQEIFCETLYLDVKSGQCVEPPERDPCNNRSVSATTVMPYLPSASSMSSLATDPSKTAATTGTSRNLYLTSESGTTSTTLSGTRISDLSVILIINSTASVSPLKLAESSTTAASQLPVTLTPPLSTTSSQRPSLGSLLVYSRRPSRPHGYRVRRPMPTTTQQSLTFEPYSYPMPSSQALSGSFTTPMSLSAYRETFNKLYAQLVNNQQGQSFSTKAYANSEKEVPSTDTSIQPALILNFNTVSGQLTNVTSGVTFQCRAEGYFRNSRDVSCSKFYLCVKVGPRQYNLFEFMCLPHNGIQWRYNQNRNACVDPVDFTEC